jgi:uncharacterized protein (DUF1778 family)
MIRALFHREVRGNLEMSGNLPYILTEETEMAEDTVRSSRLEARITPEALAVVKRAAEIQGRSISDFVVAAAQQAAQKTIEETLVLRLSLEDQIAFAEAIITPSGPNDALRRAKDAHHRLVPGTP